MKTTTKETFTKEHLEKLKHKIKLEVLNILKLVDLKLKDGLTETEFKKLTDNLIFGFSSRKKLVFIVKKQYGNVRYFPDNYEAKQFISLFRNNVKCLTETEFKKLTDNLIFGFSVDLKLKDKTLNF